MEATRYSVSSVFRYQDLAGAPSIGRLRAWAWPLSFSTRSWKTSGYRSTNSRAISIAPSVDPASWTITSRFG
jgi:hypothetical protein